MIGTTFRQTMSLLDKHRKYTFQLNCQEFIITITSDLYYYNDMLVKLD